MSIILELTDKIPFGKFKGLSIEALLDDNVYFISSQHKYLNWFNKTVTTHQFSDEVKLLLKLKLKEIADEAIEAERAWNQRQWELSQPPYSNKSSNKRSSSYTNENSWQSGINESYQEVGMNLGDMGYDGDGW